MTLVDYLAMKFPTIDAGTHMAANNAIELAQKDIVSTFIKHKTQPGQ